MINLGFAYTDPDDETAGDGGALEPGGYVVRIDDVLDVPQSRYLSLTWDVAEGPEAGHYADDWGRSHPWAHTQRAYYTDRARGIFQRLLSCLQKSNPGRFDVAAWQDAGSDESALVGLVVGALVQKRYYTNGAGEDREALEIARWMPAADIRGGNFKLPLPRDQRTPQYGRTSFKADDVDLPF